MADEKNIDLWNAVLSEMYLYMELHINKDNSYEYQSVPPYKDTYWKFIDRYGTSNGIRLLIETNRYGIKKFGEIKFGEIDSTGDISFDIPLHYDEKTFNTHVKITLTEIILKHKELDYYRLPPIDEDPRRSRLYSMAITKYLNPNEWEVFNNEKETIKNTIWIKRKQSGAIL
jgi:hypothetical protein